MAGPVDGDWSRRPLLHHNLGDHQQPRVRQRRRRSDRGRSRSPRSAGGCRQGVGRVPHNLGITYKAGGGELGAGGPRPRAGGADCAMAQAEAPGQARCERGSHAGRAEIRVGARTSWTRRGGHGRGFCDLRATAQFDLRRRDHARRGDCADGGGGSRKPRVGTFSGASAPSGPSASPPPPPSGATRTWRSCPAWHRRSVDLRQARRRSDLRASLVADTEIRNLAAQEWGDSSRPTAAGRLSPLTRRKIWPYAGRYASSHYLSAFANEIAQSPMLALLNSIGQRRSGELYLGRNGPWSRCPRSLAGDWLLVLRALNGARHRARSSWHQRGAHFFTRALAAMRDNDMASVGQCARTTWASSRTCKATTAGPSVPTPARSRPYRGALRPGARRFAAQSSASATASGRSGHACRRLRRLAGRRDVCATSGSRVAGSRGRAEIRAMKGDPCSLAGFGNGHWLVHRELKAWYCENSRTTILSGRWGSSVKRRSTAVADAPRTCDRPCATSRRGRCWSRSLRAILAYLLASTGARRPSEECALRRARFLPRPRRQVEIVRLDALLASRASGAARLGPRPILARRGAGAYRDSHPGPDRFRTQRDAWVSACKRACGGADLLSQRAPWKGCLHDGGRPRRTMPPAIAAATRRGESVLS